MMDEQKLLERITVNPQVFDGKPIVRGRRLAVEHVLGMLAAGDSIETILEGHPWLEMEDVRACLVSARQQAAVCLRVLAEHATELQSGAIITAEPGRLRIRLP